MLRREPLRARRSTGRGPGISQLEQTVHPRHRGLAESADWQQLRAWVKERDDGRCVRCGEILGEYWECHHRRLRSQGGRDVLSNLIALCSRCHHDEVHGEPAAAQLAGWIVVSGAGPLIMPVLYWDGSRRLLSDDGSYGLAA